MELSQNRIIEILFLNFIENGRTGSVSDELDRISHEIDQQIEAGAVQRETICEYELLAEQAGFYAGFLVGVELQKGLPQDSREVI